MLNSVVIMGRLTADPELKTTQNGLSVTRFTVAVERSYQKQGEEKVVDFLPCVAWRNTAEFVCEYFHKGSLIAVQGALTSRKYADKSGQNRIAYEILVDYAHFTGEKKNADTGAQSEPVVSTPPKAAPAQNQTPKYDYTQVEMDDDLPFN